jgi:4-hydroxy-tetrahydrodipicolinate reductase
MSTAGRRILVVGDGRMGRAVAAEAARAGHAVCGVIDGRRGRSPEPFTPADLRGAEVAIEFTAPAAAPAIAGRLLDAGVPVVSGTTGWAPGLDSLAARVRAEGGALLHAANFSVGAQLLFRAAAELGAAIRDRPELDASIHERHHRLKLDAPSGTALALQAALRSADPHRPYPIVSERLGSHPGLHALTIDGRFEELTITHAVRDRAVFAAGAVIAAEWLIGRQGFFGFEHVLFGDDG